MHPCNLFSRTLLVAAVVVSFNVVVLAFQSPPNCNELMPEYYPPAARIRTHAVRIVSRQVVRRKSPALGNTQPTCQRLVKRVPWAIQSV